MARSNKGPTSGGKNKNDIKTTVIVVLTCLVLAQAFLLFQHKKPAPRPVAKPKQVAVVHVAKPVKAKPVSSAALLPFKKAAPGSAGKIAFILDDWGYTMRNCKYLKEISAPLAIAVLPNLKNTESIMKCANVYDKDVMLHLPLEPYVNRDPYPDNYLITTNMKPAKVIQLVEDSLIKMPLVQGVNNHMGSKATEDKELMRTIFKRIKKRGLFFVDSKTAPHHSICEELAQEMDVAFASRDVFLDNINTKEEIEKKIGELAQKAHKKGYAIAIGHDRELTLRVLKEQIPFLEEKGFEIVRVKSLLKNK